MPTYIIRAINPELMAAFRARAQRDGHPMRWLFMQFMTKYAAGTEAAPAGGQAAPSSDTAGDR